MARGNYRASDRNYRQERDNIFTGTLTKRRSLLFYYYPELEQELVLAGRFLDDGAFNQTFRTDNDDRGLRSHSPSASRSTSPAASHRALLPDAWRHPSDQLLEMMNGTLDRIIMQARQFLEESNREGNEEMHGEPEDAEAFEAVEVVEASAEAGESVEAVDAVKGGEEMPDSGATGSDREEI